jgi:hypothetical protein
MPKNIRIFPADPRPPRAMCPGAPRPAFSISLADLSREVFAIPLRIAAECRPAAG